MIVHHNHVKGEARLLRERAFHRVADGLYAVEHGYDDRSLYGEGLLLEVGNLALAGVHPRAYLFQMSRYGTLHLHLHLAVGGIHVVELPLTTGAQVDFLFRVQELVQVEQLALPTQEEPKVVEPRIPIVGRGDELLEQGGAHQHDAAEVEIVAHTAQLPVDDGMPLPHRLCGCTFLTARWGGVGPIIGVHHRRSTHVSGHHHPSERPFSHCHLDGFYP